MQATTAAQLNSAGLIPAAATSQAVRLASQVDTQITDGGLIADGVQNAVQHEAMPIQNTLNGGFPAPPVIQNVPLANPMETSDIGSNQFSDQQFAPVVGGTSIVNSPAAPCNYSNNYTGDDAYGSEYLDYGYGCHNTSRNHLLVEGLYFSRAGGFLSSSNQFSLDPYDYTLGGRITFGTRLDDLNGREISYIGPFEWEDAALFKVQPVDSVQTLQPLPIQVLSPANLSAFNNSRYQHQAIDSSLNSIEFNRLWNGWDVMSMVLGMRYTRAEDRYAFISRNNVGEVGTFNLETTNNLIGPQIGMEMFNDTGRRLSYSIRGKIGLMANLYEGQARFNNNGFLIFNSDKDNADLSGLFEFGATAHYELGPSFRLRAGYEVLALTGMATVRDNLTNQISRNVGRNLSNDDDILYHGASVGLELFCR